MTVTTPSHQPPQPGENIPVPQPSAPQAEAGSRKTFFRAAAGGFIGRVLGDIATDVRKAMWQDWF